MSNNDHPLPTLTLTFPQPSANALAFLEAAYEASPQAIIRLLVLHQAARVSTAPYTYLDAQKAERVEALGYIHPTLEEGDDL